MPQTGHLFVVQADLTRLAADAFLVPCDTYLNVAGGWRPFLEPGTQEQASELWFTPPGLQNEDVFHFLPDATPDVEKPAPDEVVGLRVLVDTVKAESIPEMVEHSLSAVRFAATRATTRGGRALPLIAMPILGVGEGNFRGHRAEVISELIGQLLAFVSEEPVDVALVLRRPADFAAAQWARGQVTDADKTAWPELSAEHLALADRLGKKAAGGELSIFAGAGVSKPVNFPDWDELLQELADANGKTLVIPAVPQEPDYPQLAQDMQIETLNEDIATRFRTEKHALGHALLADLRTPSLVTTNYDPCLENAAAAIHTDPDPKLRVIARELALGSHPWLLKLHGDIAHPDTIVLTTDQYERLRGEHKALHGVVQTLMLTSHLLFVGFGFADSDFLGMAEAVQNVRALAQEDTSTSKVGTAIGLLEPPAPHKSPESEPGKRTYAELDYEYLARAGSDVSEAARLLEILLDRLAWRCQVTGDVRASFLLDPDYQKGASPEDEELRRKLVELQEVANRHRESAAYGAVTALLQGLGYREDTRSVRRS
ncbi:SIR2-like domain-containing protein [Raineyella antarctica]|uniref:SIR2-like domain-containing protein n=1 Tax=Raineyella antarctica TaxID=1577474 RepID=A0A1G6I9W8_9ACTN|nr:SIR2 family protein [Raineyella antarctica]SDC02546.1 SIR2-like domain-containing protein [Raineyella antarctica]